jgi:CheY-like chemotaxis protein
MYHELGRQSRRVYITLRSSIVRGDYLPGARLPAYTELAARFSVSAVTMRQVLALLEQEGLVSRQQGRGTFVQAHVPPGVLIVDDELESRALLAAYSARAGQRSIEAETPEGALELLERDPSIALLISDVRMPTAADGTAFIRTVRRRWPELPVAAITGYPDDLAPLHGTPECPVLILAKPVWEHQLQEIYRWILGPAGAPRHALEDRAESDR